MAYVGNGIGRSRIMPGQIANGAVSYDDLDTTATTPMLMFKNKIINGNFEIWQRGTSLSAATGARLIADRWIVNGIGSTVAPSQQAFTLGQTAVPGEPAYFHRSVVASVANAANAATFTQRIEGVRLLAGRTVTLSFYAKADATKNIAVEFAQVFGTGGSPSAQVYGIGVATKSLSTSFTLYTVTATLPSITGKTLGANGDDCLEVNFWFDGGSNYNSRNNTLGQQSGTFDIAQVQLEVGSNVTTYDTRPLGLELTLCQRYYFQQTSPGAMVSSGTSTGASAITSALAIFPLPVSMRVAPAIVTNITSANFVSTAPSASQWGVQSVGVAYTGISSGTMTVSNAGATPTCLFLGIFGMTFNNTPNYLTANGLYVAGNAEI